MSWRQLLMLRSPPFDPGTFVLFVSMCIIPFVLSPLSSSYTLRSTDWRKLIGPPFTKAAEIIALKYKRFNLWQNIVLWTHVNVSCVRQRIATMRVSFWEVTISLAGFYFFNKPKKREKNRGIYMASQCCARAPLQKHLPVCSWVNKSPPPPTQFVAALH